MTRLVLISGTSITAPRFLRPRQLRQSLLVSSSSLYFSLRAYSSISSSSSRNSGSSEKLREGRKGWNLSAKKHKGSLMDDDDTASGLNFASFSMDTTGKREAALPPPQGGITRVPFAKEEAQSQSQQRRLRTTSTSSRGLSSLLKQGKEEDAEWQEEDRLESKKKRKNSRTVAREKAEEEAEEIENDIGLVRGRGILDYSAHTTFPNSSDGNHNEHDDNNTVEDKENNDSNDNGLVSGTTLSNPFRGIHEHMTRSYRLDQLLALARPEDVMLGRQDTKSGAFSFIRFETGQRFLQDSKQSEFSSTSTTTTTTKDTSVGKSKSVEVNSNASLGVAHNDCALVVAERLLSFPPHMRHFHTVCGRENVPCDFFADVDLPNETATSGEKILLDMLNYLEVRLQGVGFLQPSFLILTNEVPSADKVSYHVHARAMGSSENGDEDIAEMEEQNSTSKKNEKKHNSGKKGEDEEDAEEELEDRKGNKTKNNKKKSKKKHSGNKIIAFQDYRVVKLLADEVNTTLGRAVVDEQCYRVNGMLRCAYSAKVTPGQKGKRLIPLLKAQDPALQRRLNEMRDSMQNLSEAEILARTFATRFAPCVPHTTRKQNSNSNSNTKADELRMYLKQFKFVRASHVLGPKDATALEFDVYGNAVSAYLTEGAKWRRFKSVIEKLHRLPPRTAESYDVWVRVGLALHNFSNDDHVFDEWVRFSLKCPQKYSRESCRKKWQQFERNPDALNWRRGFNYLNTTVWRAVQGH
ncbi:Prim-pol family 5 [Trypanosoma melophagium]|uniref:Prim-pol family 5 n=1 Tax=Trypanosoma melophagium TaxID=715481 RepID=UPI00351A9532|nr:Prim-pol family 5 [Trypanosoma melophagium]